MLDGGYPDPLPTYDRVFHGTEGQIPVRREVGTDVGLRFHDPQGRRDQSGRVIPHDIIVPAPLASDIRSVEDGLRLVWPRLAPAFEHVWDQPTPPTTAELLRFIDDVA